MESLSLLLPTKQEILSTEKLELHIHLTTNDPNLILASLDYYSQIIKIVPKFGLILITFFDFDLVGLFLGF
jgi:hypothetical protein